MICIFCVLVRLKKLLDAVYVMLTLHVFLNFTHARCAFDAHITHIAGVQICLTMCYVVCVTHT